MSGGSGTGRGRGWLNLNKNSQVPAIPGGNGNPSITTNSQPPSAVNKQSPSPLLQLSDQNCFVDVVAAAAPVHADDVELIEKVKHLSRHDDGILFNQKIKYILQFWTNACQTPDEVKRSFIHLYGASLLDAELATKLIIMVSSRTFLKQEINRQNIRRLFLEMLQNNFEDCSALQSANPLAFRNCILMLGEFYSRARYSSGQTLDFLLTPLVTALLMLLNETNNTTTSLVVDDVRLFVLQLRLNGTALKWICPYKLSEILTRIRTLLINDGGEIDKDCKVWLLLALDLSSNNRFDLPATNDSLVKFYESHLGVDDVAVFIGGDGVGSSGGGVVGGGGGGGDISTPTTIINTTSTTAVNNTNVSSTNVGGGGGTLSIQTTQSDNRLDCFQSNVNVLQVSNQQQQQQADSTSSSVKKTTEPIIGGRPILGAGARLNKTRLINNDTDNNEDMNCWKEINNMNNSSSSSNSSGWNCKQKNTSGSGWGGTGQNTKKGMMPPASATSIVEKKNHTNNKGWEHDDRFDTEYSN